MVKKRREEVFSHKKCSDHCEQYHTQIVNGLLEVIRAYDEYTYQHSLDVAGYALQLAKAMKLSERECSVAYYGGLFHDLGKVGVANNIINKPGPLSDREWEEVKLHPLKAAVILVQFKDFAPVVRAVLHHHERMDGSGYPDGLKGEHIPLIARIVTVADAFGALTTDRSYRKARTKIKALEEMVKHTPKQFDPEIMRVFVKLMKEARRS
jgi:putative nucleotidyltransferase with HDIG domain